MSIQQYIGYDNAVTISNVSADSEQASYPVTNLANPATNSLWKSDDASSAQYVTITTANAFQVNYVGIANHNFGTADCDIKVQIQPNSGDSWETVVDEFTPADNRVILKSWRKANLLSSSGDLTNTNVWVEKNFPTVTDNGDGSFTIEDDDNSIYEYIHNGVDIDVENWYTGGVKIKKDSISKTTRHVGVSLIYTGGQNVDDLSLRVDTSTGETRTYDSYTSEWLDYGQAELDGDYWIVKLSHKSRPQDNTKIYLRLYPARGHSSTFAGSSTATGSATFKEPQVNVGRALQDYEETPLLAPYAIRIKMTPDGGTKPQMAVVYAGEIMQMQRNIYVGHTPIPYARNVSAVSRLSESGQFLGRVIKATTYKSRVKIDHMTKDWYRLTFDSFVQASKTKPFFYAWRLTDYATEVGYCWVTGNVPVPDNTGPSGMMGVSFDISGLA